MRMYVRLIPLVVFALGLGFVSTPERAGATDWCSLAICQEWVARYDGPTSGFDLARAMAVDDAGNVYVTGESFGGNGYNLATAKYARDGNQQWVTRQNTGGWAAVRAIAVDEDGNVYVTGYDSEDYGTVKYGPDGQELWVARFTGTSNTADQAYDLALDSVGNVYVTGEYFTGGEGREFDYATISYNPDGTERWVATYNGPASLHDQARALALDGLGNVYVTGESDQDRSTSDYVTIKYDNNGNQLWTTHYEGARQDIPVAISVDDVGNIYVGGLSETADSGFDYATVKYNQDGNELWSARYNGPDSAHDMLTALAVDQEGNVYVTGYSGAELSEDWITVKYDTNGNEVWADRYDGPGNSRDFAQGLAVDSYGDVYVAGYAKGSNGDSDYTTIKYGPDGTRLWVTTYDGPATDEDRAMAISVDEAGSIYVAGWSVGIGTDYDYATIKYTPSGPVGGTVELRAAHSAPQASQPGTSGLDYAALAGGLAAAAAAITAGAWYARRRLSVLPCRWLEEEREAGESPTPREGRRP